MPTSPPAFRFALLASLCSLGLCGESSANDLKEPYRFTIVVDVAKHRLLTDVFREQLKRELKDGIQAALGKLAKVEVTDRHPKLADIRARGLQRALDSWGNAPAGDKVHFVLVEYTGTRYEIQTRQYDGTLRIASPAVRRERTRDRAYVARAAALRIEHDIGLVGTITSEPDAGRRVKVEFRGGALGVDLSRWLKEGEILGLPPAPGEPLPSALLRVEAAPKDGVATCTLFSRYRLPRATGLRAALLGTRSGHLRVRLVEEVKGKRGVFTELQPTVTLQFRRRGFDGEDATAEFVPASGTSDVLTEKRLKEGRFDRVVFISVLSGDTLKARVPVPLVDDRLVTIKVPPTDEAADEALDRFNTLRRNVLTAAQVMADLFADINELAPKADKRAEAMARVKQTLQRGRDDHKRLSRERDEVKKEIEKLPAKDQPSLAVIDERLKQIADAEDSLLRHVAVLEKIEKEENDPEKKEWERKKASAELLVKEAEVGKAIKIYEGVPAKFRTKELENHLAELKKDWAPANDDHAKAREYLYETYPKLTTAELVTHIEKEATSAFEQCKKVSDRIGPLKLLKETDRHLKRIEEEADKLKPTANGDDEKPAKLIADLLPKIRKLYRDAEAYLGKGK